MTHAEQRALLAFAKAFDPLAVTRWPDGRLEEMRSRDDCIRYGDDGDRAKWRRFERAYKRLIELGIISE